MKRLLSLILICLSLSSILTGCRDFKDLDRRLFVVAIGIDVNPDNRKEMEISIKTAVTKSQGNSGGGAQGQSDSVVYSVKGESAVEIFRMIKSKTFLEPDFSHMKLILFGSDFIENNPIDELIEFFVRRRDFQNIAYVAVARPSAKELLDKELKQENFPGNGLIMKFGQGSESPYALERKLYELYHATVTPGISPSMPIIELENDKFVMEKIAVLSNNKLAVELDREESKLFNMFTRNIKLASLSLQEDKNKLGIGLNNVKGIIKYDSSSKDIKFNVYLKATATLEDTGKGWKTLDEFSNEFSDLLTKKVEGMLKKLKDNNVDPLELEVKYWASRRDFWFTYDWLKDEVPGIKFDVKSEVKVINSGNLK